MVLMILVHYLILSKLLVHLTLLRLVVLYCAYNTLFVFVVLKLVLSGRRICFRCVEASAQW
jgi:hypothetical protein